MQKHFTTPITYFLEEGRVNLRDCLNVAFNAAEKQRIQKIIIFTSQGEGIRIALEEYCARPEFQHIQLVAVTFPAGKEFTDAEGKPMKVEISSEDRGLFKQQGIPIVQAHFPFDPIESSFRKRGNLGQDLSLVGDALNMFCGSMSLCVQAIVTACDAGAAELGEDVIVLTADTAVLARATTTRRMLRELVIREILCKPAILSISRGESAQAVFEVATEDEPKALTEPSAEHETPKE